MGSFREMVSSWRLLALVVLVAAIVVAMTLSSHAMSDLRRAVPLLSRAMSWLEHFDMPFDMDHVAFFAGMTCATRLLLPRARWWWIALAAVVLAAGTEFIQFWVPGRTPKLTDARDDLIGAGLGLSLAVPMILLGSWIRRSLRDT